MIILNSITSFLTQYENFTPNLRVILLLCSLTKFSKFGQLQITNTWHYQQIWTNLDIDINSGVAMIFSGENQLGPTKMSCEIKIQSSKMVGTIYLQHKLDFFWLTLISLFKFFIVSIENVKKLRKFILRKLKKNI